MRVTSSGELWAGECDVVTRQEDSPASVTSSGGLWASECDVARRTGLALTTNGLVAPY